MTILIILFTSIFSILAFNKPELMYKYQFNAYQIYHRKQWYRIFTHAFLHADWMHLLINMFVLFSFGSILEQYFQLYFEGKGIVYFFTLYFGSIIISTLYTLIKQKDNHYYNAVGASGAVSAIVFASIFFAPMSKLLVFGILPLPAILFGILYLGYSYYMSKKSVDNVAHDTHFWGAVFGFIFPMLIKPELYNVFLMQLFR